MGRDKVEETSDQRRGWQVGKQKHTREGAEAADVAAFSSHGISLWVKICTVPGMVVLRRQMVQPVLGKLTAALLLFSVGSNPKC